MPGPQLVVPITNARYALNAANARWGSLYDGFYGTDAMGTPAPGGYDKGRGARVVARARVFLDDAFPIDGGSHADARRYHVQGGALLVDDMPLAQPESSSATKVIRKRPTRCCCATTACMSNWFSTGRISSAAAIRPVWRMSVWKARCRRSWIARTRSPASMPRTRTLAYANWLGLMKGDLTDSFEKGGKTVNRALTPDPVYTAPDGKGDVTIKGRALMLVRNVGHLMTNPAILLKDGSEIFEGLMDAMITALIAKHDLDKTDGLRNSHHGSVYVVKPKMHGPDEVAFADETFTFVEQALGCRNTPSSWASWTRNGAPPSTSRSASVPQSIAWPSSTPGFWIAPATRFTPRWRPGRSRRKDFIKRKAWIGGYENRNVDIGLECGLSGRAQIGKGMWAMPDLMAAMLEQKIEHPKSGANCAWVPSPRRPRCTRCIITRSMSLPCTTSCAAEDAGRMWT